MYEDMTYEFLLNRMMNRVQSQYPNLDRREGSIIFDALAGSALELAIAYTELDNVLRESFVDTASREYILVACKDKGIDISVFDASAGTHKGAFNVEVPIGSRWNCDLYNFIVTELIGNEGEHYNYKLQCETVGKTPNTQTGTLVPITDVPVGLTYAELIECIIEGEDETSDEDIKKIYNERILGSISDGNINQYKLWCNEYEGVGNSKIFPLWNGKNTVKVSILSASNGVASQELINEFQEYLDPGTTGMGDGVAPIGSFVTVTTASELPINLSATIQLKEGYSDTSDISKVLEDYFKEIAYNKSVVSYMNVGAQILKSKCVDFISNLLINGGTADITLGNEEIPVLGTVSWVVS